MESNSNILSAKTPGGSAEPKAPVTELALPYGEAARVTFVNCEGYDMSCFYSDPKLSPLRNDITRTNIVSREYYVWKDGKVVLTLLFDEIVAREVTKSRDGAKFILSRTGKDSWQVELRPSLASRVRKFLIRREILLTLAAVAIFALGFMAATIFRSSEKAAEAPVEEETPVVERPLELETPTDEAPTDEAPADETPIDETPTLTPTEAEAEAKAHDALVGQYNSLIAKLARMSVTQADVDKVLAFEKEHNDELSAEIKANKAKVNAYRKFFDPAAVFIKDVRYFSPEQQEACKYYMVIKGNDPRRDFNYALHKAMELGFIK